MINLIKEIEISNRKYAEKVLNIQKLAYQVEAKLIDSDDIPPLKDTVETLQQCGEIFYGYFSKEELCGVISIKIETNEIDIHRLFVHPNHFKKGIAQSLLNVIESTSNAETIKVATGSKNIPAVNLYKKNGFEYVKEITVKEQLSLTFFKKESKFHHTD